MKHLRDTLIFIIPFILIVLLVLNMNDSKNEEEFNNDKCPFHKNCHTLRYPERERNEEL